MHMSEMLDNVSKTVKDDFTVTVNKGDKLSIAAAAMLYSACKLLAGCRLGRIPLSQRTS